ncbi:unnamed protein product [Penicillium salamii]|uniref:Uncharacterized protein n=1 Tax=Penicillium salamii TaxID=1612424 RepID=A0A9W4NTQ3_9EURO|nr:unnamed protein product [Penicillium salamii]CAG7953171.1 unnamed protein product [Penicillium salamii]CAG7961857.1 unnamed protein product [Penicillium salamii]CAG8022771.1 unnamed protein product [Penicillium salamii]CAG8084931.1 unnamed protein product [Penicillium salamii]
MESGLEELRGHDDDLVESPSQVHLSAQDISDLPIKVPGESPEPREQEKTGATPSLPTDSQNEPHEEHQEHSPGEQNDDQLQTDLSHELHTAIENDDLNVVTKLLDEGADLEAQFFYRFDPGFEVSCGLTPLLLAAGLGHGDILRLLLDRGANVAARTIEIGGTALYLAARSGRLSTVEILLEKCGEIILEESNNQGRKPLGAAARNGHLDIVELLISRGADVSATDNNDHTALHLASCKGDSRIVQRLLEESPKLLEVQNDEGDTSFAFAARCGHLNVVEYLLSQKADIYAKDVEGATAWHQSAERGQIDVVKKLYLEDPGFCDTQDDRQNTALILAAEGGHVHIVEQLLSWGSDIDARRYDNDGAIHLAARYGHVKMAEFLLRQRRDLLHSRGFHGRAPFSTAAEEGQLAMCEFLAEEGADITTMDQDEDQPIHLAAAFGHLPIVESLLDINQDLLNARGYLGQTALFQALMYSSSDVGDCLLFQKDADISIIDQNSATILHAAAYNGHLKVSKHILKAHPEIIDYKDIKGRTALSLACALGYSDFVIDLLNEGADATLKTQNGRTPLHIACYNGFLEITRLLSSPQAKYRSRNSQIAYIGASDNEGDTALVDAISENHTSIALHILEMDVLFPQSPSSVDPYVSRDKERTKVEDFLMNLLREESGEAKPNMEAAIYWAIANGRKSLLSKFVSDHGLDLKSWNRGGLSCTHVASFGDNVDLMKYLLLDQGCSLTSDPNGISPFHIAVKYNQVDLVQKMILWLDKPATDDGSASSIEPEDLALREIHGTRNGARCAILKKQNDGHTSISLAASGRYENHRKLEALLWDTLDRSIEQNKTFAPGQELDEEAHLILELAAQFDDPGTEIHLRAYLNRMMQAEAASAQNTTLRLAVHCQLPVVVWWLLSNGGYRSGNHIEDAQCLVAEWDKGDEHGRYTQIHTRDDIKEIMNEVFENPPPLLKQEPWRYEEKPPEFQHKKEKFSSLKGTVIDFFHEGHTASFQLKRRAISAIIYEDGPQKIMEPGKYGDLKSIKDKITQKPDGPPLKRRKDMHGKTVDHTSGDDTSGALVKKPKARRINGLTSNVELEESNTKRKDNDPNLAAPMLSEKTTEARKPLDLRWIHIPENNVSSELYLWISGLSCPVY